MLYIKTNPHISHPNTHTHIYIYIYISVRVFKNSGGKTAMFLSNQVQFGLSENMVPQISPLITMFPSHIAIPAGVYPIFQTSKSYVVGYIPSNFVTMVIFFPRFPWSVVYLTYPSEK